MGGDVQDLIQIQNQILYRNQDQDRNQIWTLTPIAN
jgi:hypothetical protein